jgi:hypothetical protein
MKLELLTKKLCLVAMASFFMLAGRMATAADIQIYTDEEPPTTISENGVLTGTTVDIVEALKASLGIVIPIQLVPGNRSYQAVSENPNVMAFTYGRTPEREKLGFHFIGPVITRQHALWAREKWSKALGYRLAYSSDKGFYTP